MLRLTPFLLFDGNCAEAMRFYASCLAGDLTLTRLGDTPMRQQFSPEQYSRIVNARLKTASLEFSATDWLHPTEIWHQGNTTALYLTGADLPALRSAFAALSVGADPARIVPLQAMPFGLYGHLRDRFGVEWFFRGDGASS